MQRTDRKIKALLKERKPAAVSDALLRETISKSKVAFYGAQAQSSLSYCEFLSTQGKYIRKRWWVLQAAVLLGLWVCLGFGGSGEYLQRLMGIAAPLLVVLLLPELWKNRNTGAVEVEGAAFYSLRQIYAARIFLLALMDLLLFSVFSLAVILTGRLPLEEMVISFFLPYLVTCCICFTCFYSTLAGSEILSVFLCALWSGVWLQIVLNDKVYSMISRPMWYGMLAAALCYLSVCIYRGQTHCGKNWEVKPAWN